MGERAPHRITMRGLCRGPARELLLVGASRSDKLRRSLGQLRRATSSGSACAEYQEARNLVCLEEASLQCTYICMAGRLSVPIRLTPHRSPPTLTTRLRLLYRLAMARHACLVSPPLCAYPTSWTCRKSPETAPRAEDSTDMSLLSTVLLVVALAVGGACFIMAMACVLSYEHHSSYTGKLQHAAVTTDGTDTHATLLQRCPRKQTAHMHCCSGLSNRRRTAARPPAEPALRTINATVSPPSPSNYQRYSH